MVVHVGRGWARVPCVHVMWSQGLLCGVGLRTYLLLATPLRVSALCHSPPPTPPPFVYQDWCCPVGALGRVERPHSSLSPPYTQPCSIGMSHMAEYTCCSSVAFERPNENTFTLHYPPCLSPVAPLARVCLPPTPFPVSPQALRWVPRPRPPCMIPRVALAPHGHGTVHHSPHQHPRCSPRRPHAPPTVPWGRGVVALVALGALAA